MHSFMCCNKNKVPLKADENDNREGKQTILLKMAWNKNTTLNGFQFSIPCLCQNVKECLLDNYQKYPSITKNAFIEIKDLLIHFCFLKMMSFSKLRKKGFDF